MVKLGYALSSEEHDPNTLVENARQAEDAGFEFALISDHYHPWIDRQGNSPFVWCVIGGIARATRNLRLGTGVTCPLIRIHPAIIAHAAATAAVMLPQRFFLGLGTGENLNEHILGTHWPQPSVRLSMFEEAVTVIQLLWQGGVQSFHGRYYTVDEARLYTRPENPPPLYMAADGKQAAVLAGSMGDGLIGVTPDPEMLGQFRAAGGDGKPCYGQITVCWASDEKQARKTALEWWPNSGLHGNLAWEVKTPRLFEDAVKTIREEDMESIICGPDPERYVQAIRKYEQAGYTHIYFHQIGPYQEGFFRFFGRSLAPQFSA